MDSKTLEERETILQLAIQEAFNKRDECQRDADELENKLSMMYADGCTFSEKDKVVESMMYLQKCRDGWQDMIDEIRAWQDELKA